uniref:Uncharacterized protein n=1 Tax=Panagrellus redivivus TaxID=6233 RepID=A0A7E4VAT4_PANRE
MKINLPLNPSPSSFRPANDPETAHLIQETKLRENESVRQEIYERYMPFFILSGVSFVILSFVWILYNILSYRRKQKKIRKLERINRRLEDQRLLRMYQEVSIDE